MMCDAYSYEETRAAQIPEGFKPKPINPHYTERNIQPWDAMKEWMPSEQFKGFLLGNAIKYLGRCNFKGQHKEDLLKAQRYIEKLLNECNS